MSLEPILAQTSSRDARKPRRPAVCRRVGTPGLHSPPHVALASAARTGGGKGAFAISAGPEEGEERGERGEGIQEGEERGERGEGIAGR